LAVFHVADQSVEIDRHMTDVRSVAGDAVDQRVGLAGDKAARRFEIVPVVTGEDLAADRRARDEG
jgi:hypothetical protein